ncbi:MAG: type II toxin-antitoxin system Phd/YefM family antitoxin [Caldisericaceae bacterium]|nr:type II toxin-antitoxin system Phd/YefM family antitoxin [Caldisericaceae bacterium]
MAINILKFVNTRTAKQEFTKLNRLVAEEKDMKIITKRGKPVTALISMDKLKELIGDEKFKELLYEFYTASVLEKDVQNLLRGKEKTIPFEEAKKKLGW